jgi:hypothetical protein
MGLLEKAVPYGSSPTRQQENINVKNINVQKLGRIREGSNDNITLYYTLYCMKSQLRHFIARQRLSDGIEIPCEDCYKLPNNCTKQITM